MGKSKSNLDKNTPSEVNYIEGGIYNTMPEKVIIEEMPDMIAE